MRRASPERNPVSRVVIPIEKIYEGLNPDQILELSKIQEELEGRYSGTPHLTTEIAIILLRVRRMFFP